MYYVALAYYLIPNYEKSKMFIEECIRISEEIGYDYGKALALYLLGSIYTSTGYYDKAHEAFEKALKIFEEFNDLISVAYAKIKLAELYSWRGDPHISLELCKQALDIFKKIGCKTCVAHAKGNLGRAYYYAKEYEKALKLLDEASQIVKELRYPINFTYYTTYKAWVYIAMDEHEEAIRILEELENDNLFKELRDEHTKNEFYICKATTFPRKGKTEKAKKILEKPLKTAKEFRDFDDILRSLIHLVEATKDEKYAEEACIYHKIWRIYLPLIVAKDIQHRHDYRIIVDNILSRNVSKAYEYHLNFKNKSAIDIFGAEVIRNRFSREVIKKYRKKVNIFQTLITTARSPGEVEKAVAELRESVENDLKKIVVNPFINVKDDDKVIDFHFCKKTGYFYRKMFNKVKFESLREFVEDLLNNELIRSALLGLYKHAEVVGELKEVRVEGDWVYIVYDSGRYWWAKLTRKDDLLRLLNDILIACITHPSHLSIKGIDEYGKILLLEELKGYIKNLCFMKIL